MAVDGAFGDLRRLADWFASAGAPSAQTIRSMSRIMRRLGATAVPLLGRELRGGQAARRDAAREALAWLATTPARDRVIEELRAVTTIDATDDAKVCALGLLAELGERAEARFADPLAMQRRTALALAVQLETPADIASAADLMVVQLSHDDIAQMIDILVEAAPSAAARLGGELCARLDLPGELRDQIALRLANLPTSAPVAPRRAPRPAQISVLVDAAARLVVIASKRVSGTRRWRRWAVLVGMTGRVEDCLHEEDVGEHGEVAPLVARLCADGYRVASTDADHARQVVLTAARLTAHELPSTYYLGRDLLDLRDAHLRARPRRDPGLAMLDRALDRLAAGEPAAALALLETCDASRPDIAGALGATLLAIGRHADAITAIECAIAGEPGWPLHHWNLAVALHALGDASGCHRALCTFVGTSATPSGLIGDPEQADRMIKAERMIAELERSARLLGTPLSRPRRRRSSKARARR